MKEVYTDVLFANFKIWPLASFINFYFIPFNFQVGFDSHVAVCWNTYFSYKTNLKSNNETLYAAEVKHLELRKIEEQGK